jgi:2-polyprenyl-6-methoxyphenol hydroxylase-like FAD-dependent oxidoreductase
MRVLIVGAGIAGLTLALELGRGSFDVTLIERAPCLRSEGYMIDFFGPGFDIAKRIGLLPDLSEAHYPIDDILFVDDRGRVQADLPYVRLRESVFRGRHFNFMRGDLERVLYEHLGAAVVVRFGVSPTAIERQSGAAFVSFSDGRRETFDLVVGTDGVHSRVRALVFDPAEVNQRYLGCHTAAYVIPRSVAGLSPNAFVSMSGPGLTVAAYPIRGNRTATFFVHRAEEPLGDRSTAACRRELESIFRGAGWIAADLLDAFPADGEAVYFDDVAQIEMTRWRVDNVALVGDACGCVSLVAGQGASMAVTGGYILAQELARNPADIPSALARYEMRVRPEVEKRQRSGRRTAGWFVPRTRLGAKVRDRIMHAAIRTPLARRLANPLGAGTILLD